MKLELIPKDSAELPQGWLRVIDLPQIPFPGDQLHIDGPGEDLLVIRRAFWVNHRGIDAKVWVRKAP